MFEMAPVQPNDVHNQFLVKNLHPPDWANPEPAGRYNLVVIGAGTAGLISAAGAAGLGARVALVEREFLGGDCLNAGCVPSKALIRVSWYAHAHGHLAPAEAWVRHLASKGLAKSDHGGMDMNMPGMDMGSMTGGQSATPSKVAGHAELTVAPQVLPVRSYWVRRARWLKTQRDGQQTEAKEKTESNRLHQVPATAMT